LGFAAATGILDDDAHAVASVIIGQIAEGPDAGVVLSPSRSLGGRLCPGERRRSARGASGCRTTGPPPRPPSCCPRRFPQERHCDV